MWGERRAEGHVKNIKKKKKKKKNKTKKQRIRETPKRAGKLNAEGAQERELKRERQKVRLRAQKPLEREKREGKRLRGLRGKTEAIALRSERRVRQRLIRLGWA